MRSRQQKKPNKSAHKCMKLENSQKLSNQLPRYQVFHTLIRLIWLCHHTLYLLKRKASGLIWLAAHAKVPNRFWVRQKRLLIKALRNRCLPLRETFSINDFVSQTKIWARPRGKTSSWPTSESNLTANWKKWPNVLAISKEITQLRPPQVRLFHPDLKTKTGLLRSETEKNTREPEMRLKSIHKLKNWVKIGQEKR